MGGAISMSLADDDVSSFDPIVPFDNMSIWTMLLIYDQILRVDAEGTGLEGGLAETWDVSDDNLTYTFHLRETNFHDGTPCTVGRRGVLSRSHRQGRGIGLGIPVFRR